MGRGRRWAGRVEEAGKTIGALLLLAGLVVWGTWGCWPRSWEKEEFLRSHLERACDAVEAACGAPMARRPVLTMSPREKVLGLIRAAGGSLTAAEGC